MGFLKGSKDEVTIHIVTRIEVDLGQIIAVPYKATYKRPTVAEAKEVAEQCQAKSMTDDDVIARYLVNITDLVGEDNQPVEFSPELVTEMMAHKDYRASLVDGYLRISTDKKLYELIHAKN